MHKYAATGRPSTLPLPAAHRAAGASATVHPIAGEPRQERDDVRNFINGRYISNFDAVYRFFDLDMQGVHPSTLALLQPLRPSFRLIVARPVLEPQTRGDHHTHNIYESDGESPIDLLACPILSLMWWGRGPRVRTGCASFLRSCAKKVQNDAHME